MTKATKYEATNRSYGDIPQASKQKGWEKEFREFLSKESYHGGGLPGGQFYDGYNYCGKIILPFIRTLLRQRDDTAYGKF